MVHWFLADAGARGLPGPPSVHGASIRVVSLGVRVKERLASSQHIVELEASTTLVGSAGQS
jgi:hypothetical protein